MFYRLPKRAKIVSAAGQPAVCPVLSLIFGRLGYGETIFFLQFSASHTQNMLNIRYSTPFCAHSLAGDGPSVQYSDPVQDGGEEPLQDVGERWRWWAPVPVGPGRGWIEDKEQHRAVTCW